MATPKISVILPCYQAEEYLADVMQDLHNQSFQDIEIILVNDGGSKRQLELMHQFKADEEKIIIIDKPNGGISSARNAGVDVAKGAYIVFADPDDRLKPFFLQRLFENISTENTTIAVGGYVIELVMEKRTINEFINCSSLPTKDSTVERLLSFPTVRNASWNKIYKRSFLEEHHLRFDEQLLFGEDESFNMHCLLLTNNISLIPECGYIYECRDSASICSKYVKGFQDLRLSAISLRTEVMKKRGMSEEAIHQILTEEYYLLGYFILCNLYKKNSPHSFWEKRNLIKKQIFGHKAIAAAFYDSKDRPLNLMTSIYSCCFKLHNATAMALTFQLLYGLKNNFRSFYLQLAPRFKNYLKKN